MSLSESSTPQATPPKGVLPVIFVTLFLDLVGFSIIFPLFPAMLDHYLERESHGMLMGAMLQAVASLRDVLGVPSSAGDAILFGGILGSLYSFLQFACAPTLGMISDRIGRRPVLIVTIAGVAFSYVLWFFADAFWVLVAARLIGGVMSANISTASAAVADVTTQETRSKGMAIIGAAFGMGFIVGPAIGGISAMVDLSAHFPGLVAYGVNPFSLPALIAFLLSAINLVFVCMRFPETLPARGASEDLPKRSANPLRLFSFGNYPGVTQANLAYFIFLMSFAGMEFSLTFLAADRLGYGPQALGLMLLYVGLVLVLVQVMYVRKHGDKVGPKRVVLQGLCCAIPALIIIGSAYNLPVLLVGLTLMAMGSGQVIPCLSSLVSLYTPSHEQGRVLGAFRSAGALARAIGPALVGVVYWRLGPSTAYYACSVVILVPLALTALLPAPAAVAPIAAELKG